MILPQSERHTIIKQTAILMQHQSKPSLPNFQVVPAIGVDAIQ